MQKYILLFSLFFLINANAQKAQKAINLFAADPIMKSGRLSFLAIDLESDSIIGSYMKDSSLVTASTTKLFTTATAFEVLGKNYTPVTRIYADGPIDQNGILHGNLWIRGSGDVSMGSSYFNSEGHEFDFLSNWTDSIILMGIKRIEGAVIADGSAYGYDGPPIGWKDDDIGNYFGAPHAGINLYDNMIKLNFQTGGAGSKAKLVTIFPKVDSLVMNCAVTAVASSGDDCYIDGKIFSLNRKARGTIPANRNAFQVKGSLPDSEYQLAKEWTAVLKQKGITVDNRANGYRLLSPKLENDYSENFHLLFSQPGKSIKDVAYWTNLKSVNLFAEGLLDYLGYAKTGDGSTSSSLKVLRGYWDQKINLTNMKINDGSGLSRLNAISATNFCDLLEFMYKSPNFLDFKSTLPVAGVSGTLRNICKGQVGQGRVIAKSGTLNKVKAYAGYVETISGKKVAFSFCVNNYSCSTSQLINKMAVVLNALAEY